MICCCQAQSQLQLSYSWTWAGISITISSRRRRRRRRRRGRPSGKVLFSSKIIVYSASMAINISYSISKWSLEQFQFNGILFYISQCLLPPLNVHQSSKLNCRLSVIDKPFIVYCPLFCFITGIIPLIWQSVTFNSYSKDWKRYYKLFSFNKFENGVTGSATEISF